MASLGEIPNRSMGNLGTQAGIRDPIPSFPTSLPDPSGVSLLLGKPREIRGPREGSLGNAGKECHRGSFGTGTRLLQPPVSCSESFRSLETCVRCLQVKQVCNQDQVLHGDHPVCSFFHSAGRLDDLHGYERCILSCPYSPGVQTIPEVHVQPQSVSVQGPLLRTEHGSSGLYQGFGSLGEDNPLGGVQDCSIPGRLVDHSIFQSRAVESKDVYTETDDRIRHTDQLREICPRPFSSHYLSGGCDRFKDFLGFSLRETCQQRPVNNLRILILRSKAREIMAVSARAHVLTGEVYSRSETQDETSAISIETTVGRVVPIHHHPDSTVPRSGPKMVEQQGQALKGHLSGSEEPTTSVVLGCIPRRLGGCCGGTPSVREMVPGGQIRTYKSPRTKSSLAGASTSGGSGERQSNLGVLGQHHGSFIYCEARGHQVMGYVRPSERPYSLAGSSRDNSSPSVHSGTEKRSGRLPQQEGANLTNRMDSASRGLQSTVAAMGSTLNRSLCHEFDQEAPKLHVSTCRPSGSSSRCPTARLVQSGPLRFSSFRHYKRSDKQIQKHPKQLDDFSRSVVASEGVVPRLDKTPRRRTKAASTQTRPSVSASGEGSTPKPPHASLNRVETLHSLLKFRKFSDPVAKSIQEARGPSTNALYQQRWAVFVSWCRTRKLSASRPSVNQLCEFFLFLFEKKGMVVSTIKGYRSALHSVLRHTGLIINSDPDIADVIRSLSIRAPRKPKKVVHWNLDVVLKFLCSDKFEPLHSSSLLSLTKKTLILVALALAKRISELQALSREVGFSSEGALLSLLLSFRAKNDFKCKRLPRNFLIKQLTSLVGDEEEALLCPVRALREYIRRTKDLVGPNMFQLFVSPRTPTRPASKNALTCLIRLVITEAHESLCPELLPILKVKSHELRAVSTSVAFKHNLSLDAVMEAAQWRCHNVFAAHYLKEVSFEYADCRTLGPLLVAGTVIT